MPTSMITKANAEIIANSTIAWPRLNRIAACEAPRTHSFSFRSNRFCIELFTRLYWVRRGGEIGPRVGDPPEDESVLPATACTKHALSCVRVLVFSKYTSANPSIVVGDLVKSTAGTVTRHGSPAGILSGFPPLQGSGESAGQLASLAVMAES